MFEKVRENLVSLGYTVSVFESKTDASSYLDSAIDGKKVGFGGSVTVAEMGLYDLLGKHNTVTSHARIPEGKTDSDMRMASRGADIYISSVNGLSEDGEIINIDATGNRVASIFYGHEKVYLIIGKTSSLTIMTARYGALEISLLRRTLSVSELKLPAPRRRISATTARARNASAADLRFYGKSR